MKKGVTEIIVVLDRSGSMESIRADMCGGFDMFIREQKEQPGECLVTLAQFDTQYELVYAGRPIAEVPPLVLEPRGGTALLDAVGKTIDSTGSRLKALPEESRPEHVLFLIITDGGENSSHEMKRADVRRRVEHQTTKYDWKFVYLGANQDSFAEAGAIGVAMASNFVANSAGVKHLYGSVSANTSRLRGGGSYQP